MKRFLLTSAVLLAVLFCAEAHAKELFTFEGTLDLTANRFNVDVDLGNESSIKATGERTEADDYRLDLAIEHLKSPFFEISSQVQSSLAFSPAQDSSGPVLIGELSSQYSLLDYKPIKELSGYFEVKDNRVYFNSLSFGNIAWNGFVEFVRPYRVDLIVELDKVPMEHFIGFWAPQSAYDSSGLVSGEIKLSGTFDELRMNGNLYAYNGHIENLKYDNIHLTASGVYPQINIAESVISKEDGFSFVVNGPVDISDRENFKRQVKALKVSPIVSDTASKTEWTIKRVQAQASASTEFKYLLRKDELNPSGSEESAMLGVEQKLEF